ncbi:MAG: sulfatase-like hydrolase/transferase [Mesorhizobium sp.]|nr:sulfatase-like hydrolase/transferase [Mesorhizobium sp.]
MVETLAFAVFLICACFGPLLAWGYFGAPATFPASSLALAVAVLWLAGAGARSRWKSGLLFVFVTIMLVLNSALTESYYLSGTGFAESFFYHLRVDLAFAGLAEHFGLIALALLLLAGALVAFGFATRRPGRPAVLPMIATAAALCLWSPLLGIGAYLGDAVAYARPGGIAAWALEPFGHPALVQAPSPESVRSAGAVRLGRPMNLVLLYGESLEQSYLDNPGFSALTANLRAVRDRSLHFSDVSPGFSSDWTIAGLVATQCGYPLIDDPLVNAVLSRPLTGARPALPNAVCLGDVLAANGYHVVYVGGADTRFAGKRDFLRRHGFHEVLGTPEIAAYLGRHPEVDPDPALGPWGYHDQTTLKVAMHRFQRLSADGRPFALIALTLDTHHPNGLPSPDCRVDGEDSMRNAIRCTAEGFAAFIAAIRAGPYSAGTLIGVLSDHLAHRTSQTPRLPPRGERRLTFFVNAPHLAAGRITNSGTVFDVAATIVDLLDGGAHVLGAGQSLLRGPGLLHQFGVNTRQKQYFLSPAMSTRLRELDRDPMRQGVR